MIKNYTELDPHKFNLSKIITYNNEKVEVLTVCLAPFGVNNTGYKTNIKFKIEEPAFLQFLQKLDSCAEKKLLGKYVPILKQYQEDYYFLATIPKSYNKLKTKFFNQHGSQIVSSALDKTKLQDVFLSLKYVWSREGFTGITITVDQICQKKETEISDDK